MGRPNTTSDLLRPMSIGDIMDSAVKLYRSNFFLLIGIGAWVYIPLCLLGFFISQAIFNLLIQLVSIFLAAVVTVAISERILNHEISISNAYSRTSKRLGSFIGAMMLVGLIGMSLLIIVGIFVSIFSSIFFKALRFPFGSLIFTLIVALFTVAIMVWLLFIPQAVLLEGNKAIKSIGRNSKIVSGNFWKAYATLVLVSIAMFVITSFLWLIGGSVMAILGGDANTAGSFAQNFEASVNRFRQFPPGIGAVNLLLQPFRMVVITLLYYDIRVRKEGYDLEIMAKELAMETPGEQGNHGESQKA